MKGIDLNEEIDMFEDYIYRISPFHKPNKYVLEAILKNEICKRINLALGINLYKWQKEFLFNNAGIPEDLLLMRGSGETTIKIIKKLLMYKEPMHIKDIHKLSDRPLDRFYSDRWFVNEFMRIREKLKRKGFKVMEVLIK